MKKIYLIPPFIWLLFILFSSFANPGTSNFSKYCKQQGMEIIPSGGMVYNGKYTTIQSFCISAGEISNKQYRTFLSDLKANGKTDELAIAMIDSTKWRLPNTSMETFVEQYATSEEFAEYPVVNISQAAARLYCDWLSEKFKKDGYDVKVRLPYEIEWNYAANCGNTDWQYAWEGNFTRDKKGRYLANYKSEPITDDGGYVTTITKSYQPNDFGVYNMCGNVAEWISDDGRTKGGSWWSDAEHIKINGPDEYKGTVDASPFIGFRPVFTFTEFNQ